MAIFYLSRAVIGSKIQEKIKTGIQTYGVNNFLANYVPSFPAINWETVHRLQPILVLRTAFRIFQSSALSSINYFLTTEVGIPFTQILPYCLNRHTPA